MVAPAALSSPNGDLHVLRTDRSSPQITPQNASHIRTAIHLVMREVLLLCISSNTVALAVAVIFGWATPFASSTTPYARQGFTLWIVLFGCLFGLLAVSPLVAHVLRGPTLSTVQATWLLLRQSWLILVVYSALGPAIVFSILRAGGGSIVHYNLHSAITVLITTVGCMRLMTKAVSIFRRGRLNGIVPSVSTIHPANTAHITKAQRAPRSVSWKTTLRKVSSLTLPSAVSAVLTSQYLMLARQIQFTTPFTFLMFSLGSTLLKTLLPIATKLFMSKTRIRNSRNSLFMLAAPIMHVEVQMRMAVMRAYQQSTPIYISSAMLNTLEILMRMATVAVDIMVVSRARRKKDRDQLTAMGATQVVGGAHNKATNEALATRVQELESEFKQWKHEHLRNCSNEILAAMAAEYCSIAVVTLYMVVLHGHRNLDLPVTSATTMRELVTEQTISLVTQVAFEMVTDVVAIFIEMRVGIPLLATLENDREHFLRWVIPAVVVHTCGLCLSSLVVFD